MSGGHKDILGMRNGARAPDEDADDPRFYKASDGNRNGRPVMGLSLVLKSGQRRGFYYHDIKFPEFETGEDGEELVSFLAPPKLVIISGKGIEQIYDGLMRLTVKSIYEYDGRQTKAGDPIVTGIEIIEPSSKGRDEKNELKLVTPSKKSV
jgi:hypothetical protein